MSLNSNQVMNGTVEPNEEEYTIHPKTWMDEIINKYREYEDAEEFDVFKRTHELEHQYEQNSDEQNFADEQTFELETQIAKSLCINTLSFQKLATDIYNDYKCPEPERIDTPELMLILDELKQFPQLHKEQCYYTFICKETNWRHVIIPQPPYRFYGDDDYDDRPKPYEDNFWGGFIVKYNLDTLIIPTSNMPKNLLLNCSIVKSIETGNLKARVIKPCFDIEENGEEIPIPKPTDKMFWKWVLFHDLVLNVDTFPILKQMKMDIDDLKDARPFESYQTIYGSIVL